MFQNGCHGGHLGNLMGINFTRKIEDNFSGDPIGL